MLATNYSLTTYYTSLLSLDKVLISILSMLAIDINAQGGEYGNVL